MWGTVWGEAVIRPSSTLEMTAEGHPPVRKAAAPGDGAILRRPRYTDSMDDPALLAAQTAAEALITLGWPVVPTAYDIDQW